MYTARPHSAAALFSDASHVPCLRKSSSATRARTHGNELVRRPPPAATASEKRDISQQRANAARGKVCVRRHGGVAFCLQLSSVVVLPSRDDASGQSAPQRRDSCSHQVLCYVYDWRGALQSAQFHQHATTAYRTTNCAQAQSQPTLRHDYTTHGVSRRLCLRSRITLSKYLYRAAVRPKSAETFGQFPTMFAVFRATQFNNFHILDVAAICHIIARALIPQCIIIIAIRSLHAGRSPLMKINTKNRLHDGRHQTCTHRRIANCAIMPVMIKRGALPAVCDDHAIDGRIYGPVTRDFFARACRRTSCNN